MDAAIDLTGYAHALGRAQAAWRFASPELRKASALAAVSAAWETFRRDAGAGAVGPAQESKPAQLLRTDDPRRDGVLLWLADHGAPEIAEAAATVVRMVGAVHRFGAEEHALLDAARDALVHFAKAPGPIRTIIRGKSGRDDAVFRSLDAIEGAVDRLRDDVSFREGDGVEVRHALPRGTLTRYVSAEPAGCWALNLALLTAEQSACAPPPPGLVSRLVFRGELDPEESVEHLIESATSAWSAAYDRLVRLQAELGRGHAALAHLSRNARTRDAWVLVAALSGGKRTQLAQALGLSRAGADIQVHALANAGLVTLAAGGTIAWSPGSTMKGAVSPALEQGPLGGAVSELDASLAEVDRLLARTSR